MVRVLAVELSALEIVLPTVNVLAELLSQVWLAPRATIALPVLTAPVPLFIWMPTPETPLRVRVLAPAPTVTPAVLPASKSNSPIGMLPLAVGAVV